MRRVIFNKKGGVGKSTIACNLAALSAAAGKPTLLIDLDAQCNSSQYLLGAEAEGIESTVADFFRSFLQFRLLRDEPELFVHPTTWPNLYVMPAHPDLDDLQTKLESRYKMFKLKEALDKMPGYENIFIDTPPALSFYTLSALIASDSCLIPFDCDDFSRKALYALLDNVQEIRQDHNPALRVEGIIVNQFLARAKQPARIVQRLQEEGLPILEPFLSSSVKIRESHEQAIPLIHLLPKHKLSQQYAALYQGLTHTRRIGRQTKRQQPGQRQPQALR